MSNRMSGFDVYRTYLALKMHFTKENFDFFHYGGKVLVKLATYEKRTDYYFFETIARKLTIREVKEYLLSSFVLSENPSKVWIGDIKRDGKNNWIRWRKSVDSRTYNFEQELDIIYTKIQSGVSFDELFMSDGHPPILKMFIRGDISLDTLIILDMVLGFSKDWNEKLKDPLWESLSFKIRKYKPFLSIPVSKYKKKMKEKFI